MSGTWEEVSRGHSSCWQRADTERIRSEDSPANEGLNIELRPNSVRNAAIGGIAYP